MEANNASQPSEEPAEEEQSSQVTSEEGTATNQNSSEQQQNSSKEDATVSEPSSEQDKQHKPDKENITKLDKHQYVEVIKINQSRSESENIGQKHNHIKEQHNTESSGAVEGSKDTEKPQESDKQQSEEPMDNNNPPSLQPEQQEQEEEQEENDPQPIESDQPQQISTECDTEAGAEKMDVSTAEDDSNKGEDVTMETNAEPTHSTPETDQPSNEVITNEPCTGNDEVQLEPEATAKDSQLEVEEMEQRPSEVDPPVSEEGAKPQDEIANKEEERSVEIKAMEQVTDEEAPRTDITSTEDERTTEVKEVEPTTKEKPTSEDVHPVKDRVAAESFTLELDEDPLGNSSIFIEDEHSNEVVVEPNISPPVSKKRKGKPRKLGTRTARSKVVTLCV